MGILIATWRMAKEGIEIGAELLRNNENAAEAIEAAVKEVENFPYYKSVGYGGLPNEDMEVELDAGFMDGDTLAVGAVAALRDFANPISIARQLSARRSNCVLVGNGAERFASLAGFERKNMLSERAKAFYWKQKKETDDLKPYRGHDTVGVLCLDHSGKLCAATSTSGLFMKKKGRVGDSPLIGCGFYADSAVGGAVATGLGEDLMKGCISYETVRLLKDGLSPQRACEKAVFDLEEKLLEKGLKAGDLSVIALDKQGKWGAASTIDSFSFAVIEESQKEARVYLVERQGKQCEIKLASKEWMDDYMRARMAPIKEE